LPHDAIVRQRRGILYGLKHVSKKLIHINSKY